MAKARDQPASAAERMLRAAADLLQTGGIEAVSTRAVAAAAGVQPPTIYRQFGDKDGLLDAVAGFVLERYLEKKRLLTDASRDPTVELLTEVIGRLGDQGRLRMSVERATAYFRSCGAGFILIQIGTQPGQRD